MSRQGCPRLEAVNRPDWKPSNNLVLYPDESFLVAKRTSGAATFTSEGVVETVNANLKLPATGKFAITNNPYGTDMKLCELIPSTAIGTGHGQFRPGSSDSDGDTVTFLEGTQWKKFWYKSGENSAVTSMHVIGTRRPMEGGSVAGSLDATICILALVVYLLWKVVMQVEQLLASLAMMPTTQSFNSGATSDLVGFSITFSEVNGYMLYDGGTTEASNVSKWIRNYFREWFISSV